MRLDRRLALSAGLSRKDARVVVRGGLVVGPNGPLRDPGADVNADTPLTLRGAPLEPATPLYLALHKTAGTVCARDDARSVLALLPEAWARRVEPVGRLDVDTTGLLLLTDDGGWSHRIASPQAGCVKVYRARLDGPLPAGAHARLEAGVMLHGEATAARADVVEDGPEGLLLAVTEGRYHLVKRLVAAVGGHVVALHRERVGPLTLDLAPGQVRALRGDEVAALATPSPFDDR